MSAPKKRATKKAAAKKPAAKKLAKKAAAKKPKAAPRVPRTAVQLKAAKEARGALLPEAIKLGRTLLKGWRTLSALADHLKAKQADHPLAPDMLDMSDWRNLALRVNRHFEKQDAIEAQGRKHGPTCKVHKVCTLAEGASQYRITPGAKVGVEPIKRRVKAAAKVGKAKAKKQTLKGKGLPKKAATKAPAKGTKAAPKKRGK